MKLGVYTNITDTANEIGDQGTVAELIDEKAGKPEKPDFVF